MASTDTNNNYVILATLNDPRFQDRCYRRFIAAAVSVTTEVNTVTSHTQRLAFAGALFNGTVSNHMLAALILANPTNQTNALADPIVPGGNILDSDIDFQANSVFTGVATSRAW